MRWVALCSTGLAIVVATALAFVWSRAGENPTPQLQPPSAAAVRIDEEWDRARSQVPSVSAGRAVVTLARAETRTASRGDAADTFGESCQQGHSLPPDESLAPDAQKVEIDGREFLTNRRLAGRVEDTTIRRSLAYAYTCSPLWRIVVDTAAERGATLRFETLPDDVSGAFYSGRNQASLNPALRSERPEVIAATIAHEMYHASHDAPSDVGCTLQDEINAYGWEAYVWSRFARVPPSTPKEAILGQIVQQWQSRTLDEFVLTAPGYQRNLFGRVLESP